MTLSLLAYEARKQREVGQRGEWTAWLDSATALGSLLGLSFSLLPSALLPSTWCLWDNELLLEAGANYCFCRTGGCLDERGWSQAPGSVPQLGAPGHAREPCGP